MYLTLDLIEKDPDVDKGKIIQATSKLPATVDDAYERILSTSSKPEKTRRLLHIIVAAERPLSLREMNFALALQQHHRAPSEVDLIPDVRFREWLRDACGLFVTVIKSKIYLLHQTAREFLIRTDSGNRPPDRSGDAPKWKHSLALSESHQILAETCLRRLRFPTNYQPEDRDLSLKSFYLDPRLLDDRSGGFIVYPVAFWTTHLRAPHVKLDEHMIQAVLEICSAVQKHDPYWFTAFRQKRLERKRLPMLYTNGIRDLNSTRLIVASCSGAVPAVEALLRADDGDQIDAQDGLGMTALHWVATLGYTEVAETLIKGPRGPLRDLQRLLFWNGCASIEKNDRRGPAPWAGVGMMAPGSVARVFLVRKGANVEARDNHGMTALVLAILTRHPAVTKVLLENGVLINKGMEALWRALTWHDGPVMVSFELLLERGADINAVDVEGRTILSRAVSDIQSLVAVGILLDHNADVEQADSRGRTPLWYAAARRRPASVKQLLEQGANIHSTDLDGISILSSAIIGRRYTKYSDNFARQGFWYGADVVPIDDALELRGFQSLESNISALSVVHLLLERGADVHSTDSCGASALWYAATDSDPSVAELLLQHGADINMKDKGGMAPLGRARSRLGSPETARFLAERGARIY